MKKYFVVPVLVALVFAVHGNASAQTVDLSTINAKAVAIYGWKNGTPILLYGKNQYTPFAIASITKLVTAKAVETLYPETRLFTMDKTAIATLETTPGITLGATFTRDDLLEAMLISSSNDAATEFAEPNTKLFMATMNNFLHANNYTSTSFTNPTGLDPVSKKTPPNQMTPYNVSRLLSDIYLHDPLLTSMLEQKSGTIINQTTQAQVTLKSTNPLNADPAYENLVILGKTGTTNIAGENVVFITPGNSTYDYVTVALFDSGDRYGDGKTILDWLTQVLHYTA